MRAEKGLHCARPWHETYTLWLARSVLGTMIHPVPSASFRASLARFTAPFSWELFPSVRLCIKPSYFEVFRGEKPPFPCRSCSQLLPTVQRWGYFSLQGLTCGKMGYYFFFSTRTQCLEHLPGRCETQDHGLPPSQP